MVDSDLQSELKKRQPFSTREEEVLLNIRRTDDVLQAEFARLFKGLGISDPQYNVLRILRGEGHPLPCLEVAGRMVTRLPDITRLVDRLESSGLVERSRTQEDRRVVLIGITSAGLELLKRLDEPVKQLTAQLLGHLSKTELETLNHLLNRVRSARNATGE